MTYEIRISIEGFRHAEHVFGHVFLLPSCNLPFQSFKFFYVSKKDVSSCIPVSLILTNPFEKSKRLVESKFKGAP